MANEQSKAAKRRYYDGAYHLRYFAGHGLDVGGGNDPLGNYCKHFARMLSCRNWDLKDGDAQLLIGVEDQSLDFVHSSHCLEHLRQPDAALENWLRVVKSGGFVIVTIPAESLYERGHWPSRFNADHKWAFAMNKPHAKAHEINVVTFLDSFSRAAEVERLIFHRDFFDDSLPVATDQTWTGNAECAIEFVLRKR